MARTGRPGLSHEEKAELWRRWKAGETLSDIGRALGKHAASVFGVVAAKGGFAPGPRSRKSGSLSLIERQEISRGLVSGRSFRQIGRDLGRAVSRGQPRSCQERRAPGLSRRPGLRNMGWIAPSGASPASWHSTRPCANWLPESCRANGRHSRSLWWLKARYPGDPFMNVLHETIYKSLFIQAPRSEKWASSRRSSWPICAAAGSCAGAGQRQRQDRRGARS